LSALSLVVGWFASGWLVDLRAEHTRVHVTLVLPTVAPFMMVIELYGSSEFKQGEREREREREPLKVLLPNCLVCCFDQAISFQQGL